MNILLKIGINLSNKKTENPSQSGNQKRRRTQAKVGTKKDGEPKPKWELKKFIGGIEKMPSFSIKK
jgi:hypothetical protein